MAFHSELFSFVVYPNYNNAIRFLAENLASDEEWDFSDIHEKKYSILKNYLEFTYSVRNLL